MRPLSAPLLALAFILVCSLGGIAGADSYYVITATAGPGGSIVPSENVLVILNGSEDFTIIPDFGYRIEDVLVNGRSVGPRSVYTFYDVYYDQSIAASFSPLPGSVSIESDPPGASVYIDGMYVGRTKQKGAVVIDNVPAGSRAIELILDGYSPWSGQVQVKGGETTNVPLILLLPLTVPTTPPPTTVPTTVPPSTIPTTALTTIPTTVPTTIPTTAPTTLPTTRPTSAPTTSLPPPTTSIPATTTIPTTVRTTIPTTLVTTIPPTTSLTTTQATTTIQTSVSTPSPTPTSTGTTIPFTTATPTSTTVSPTSTTTTLTRTTLTIPPSATTPTQQTATIVPGVSDTEPILSPPTTPGPTPPVTVEPVTSTTTPVPLFPLLPRGIDPSLILLLAGSLAVVPLAVDLAGRPRMALVLQKGRKAIITSTYLLVIAGLAAAGVLAWRSGVFGGSLSPFTSMILPISVYLVCSGFILIPGTLLSKPLRWTLSGHLLFSLAGIFVAALALITTPLTFRLPLLLVAGSACAGAVIARWESRCMGPCRDPEIAQETLILPRSPTIPNAFPAELLERYSEPQLIGMGGVSRVFRAIQNQTGETVALKIPVQFNETAGKCFMKEIKAWEDLSHENIVKIHEVNILPVPYVEMEFIESSLADIKKPLPPGDAARIVRDIARGLHYAHSQGIVHRDIKPQNILMDGEGIPRITDWGMSKVMGAGSLPTITGFSLSYAAPEQISPNRFGDTDQRTDIYQIGVVFFELLTGELPFGGDDIPRVSSRILTEMPPAPSMLNTAALAYDGIVMRCLEKAQSARYQSVQEMVDDLEKILVTQIDIERYEIFDE